MNGFLTAAKAGALRFNDQGGWMRASHVALSLMMALFPFCIFSLALAGLLGSSIQSEDMIELVFGSWPDVVAEPVTREVRAVLQQSDTKTLTFGALLTLFFASNGVDAARQGIAEAYFETDRRSFWHTRLLALVFVIGGGAVLVLSGFFSVALPILFHFFDDAAHMFGLDAFRSEWVRLLISAGLTFFMLFACHRWLSGVRKTFRDIWPGIALTMVLWYAGGKAFEFYIAKYAIYSVTYAGLAGVMTALVFLYLMAVIFIYGAEVNGSLIRLRAGKPPR